MDGYCKLQVMFLNKFSNNQSKEFAMTLPKTEIQKLQELKKQSEAEQRKERHYRALETEFYYMRGQELRQSYSRNNQREMRA